MWACSWLSKAAPWLSKQLIAPCVPGSLAPQGSSCQSPYPRGLPHALTDPRDLGQAGSTQAAEAEPGRVCSQLRAGLPPWRWAKWTRCCGRPRVRCGEQPSACKSCQKTRERWSCQLAEGRSEGVRCLAKRGTRFTLRESSGLSEGRCSPRGQEVPRHTVLSSWENAAARCPPNQTQSGTKIDYHSKFSQDEGHFLLLVALSTRKKKQKDWSVHWLLSSLENKWEILRSKSFLCGEIVKRTEKRDVVQTCLQLFFLEHSQKLLCLAMNLTVTRVVQLSTFK